MYLQYVNIIIYEFYTPLHIKYLVLYVKHFVENNKIYTST